MSKILVYNKKFEVEDRSITVAQKSYHLHRYRQIDCDFDVGYYYDYYDYMFFIEGIQVIWGRQYNDTSEYMSFKIDPRKVFEGGIDIILNCLKSDYKINCFEYLENGRYHELVQKQMEEK